MTTLKQFIEQSHINPKLIRAVVRQCGGWESFKEIAQDVTNHGANSGFHGFIYYNETIPFFRKNRKSIITMASNQAKEMGYEFFEFFHGFGSIGIGYEAEEIAQFLYGRPDWDGDATIPNCLAWYALEEVSRSYADYMED